LAIRGHRGQLVKLVFKEKLDRRDPKARLVKLGLVAL
jgi:hypothetical protein